MAYLAVKQIAELLKKVIFKKSCIQCLQTSKNMFEFFKTKNSSHDGPDATVWKLRKFTLELFEKKFVRVTFLQKKLRIELI